ncbi:helix-turn-helix domain-containing protein [Aliamphritea spongicola]
MQTTPTRFYLQLRLQRAQQLLRQTNMALLEIGLACGFANKNYFCKCYRDFWHPAGEERRNVQGLLPDGLPPHLFCNETAIRRFLWILTCFFCRLSSGKCDI